MTTTLSILALIVLIALFLFVRRKAEKSSERPLPPRPASAGSTSAFHAVSIKLGANACEAAKAMAGKRFLSGAAPRIPLGDCNVLECKCRFVHHKDRRHNDDRRSPFGQGLSSATGTHPTEQRRAGDRRADTSDDLF
jgi:hypothetical protein